MGLDAVFTKHGTDKCGAFHGYADVYEREFAGLVGRPEGALMEIGVFQGASMRGWREWLPPGWKVVGVENGAQTGGAIVDVEGCLIVKADAGNAEVMQKVGEGEGPFDIIIDDGSHDSADVQASFAGLWTAVKPGGVYVVEDLHAAYQRQFNMALIDWLVAVIEELNKRGRYQTANPRNSIDFANLEPLSPLERELERITLHPSMAFFWKRLEPISIEPPEVPPCE